jgi:predicted nucleotidyltransferase
MRSKMRARSSSSAGVIFLDRTERLDELRAMARRAAQRMPSIERVVLFGSLATGAATAHSDADLMIVLADSELAPRDRIPPVLEAMSPVRLPIDLFVFTRGELLQPTGVARRALEEGIDLLSPARLRESDP